jgi:hypothetical protein
MPPVQPRVCSKKFPSSEHCSLRAHCAALRLVRTPQECKHRLSRGNLSFVINGEVTQYYSVAPMTFQLDRVGISVRIFPVETGEVAASCSDVRASRTNFSTPDGMLEEMAEEVRDELE